MLLVFVFVVVGVVVVVVVCVLSWLLLFVVADVFGFCCCFGLVCNLRLSWLLTLSMLSLSLLMCVCCRLWLLALWSSFVVACALSLLFVLALWLMFMLVFVVIAVVGLVGVCRCCLCLLLSLLSLSVLLFVFVGVGDNVVGVCDCFIVTVIVTTCGRCGCCY